MLLRSDNKHKLNIYNYTYIFCNVCHRQDVNPDIAGFVFLFYQLSRLQLLMTLKFENRLIKST